MPDRTIVETPFLRLVDRDGWFFVERPNASGVVTIVPLTDDGRVVLVEQHRPPVNCRVIEFPAGLVGDEAIHANEALAAGAARELLEETGYEAARLEPVAACPTSPGMTNEVANFFVATGLVRVSSGGGTAGEQIRVHEVPLDGAAAWLRARQAEGMLVAAKVYAGLWFAREAASRTGEGPGSDP